MTALVHLVTGQTGAGKTTYAQQLAEQQNGVRFSIDEWMTSLFWMDSPDGITFSWAMTRIARCEEMIRQQAQTFLRHNIAVVLDLGFTKRDQRIAFTGWAARRAEETHLHWVDVPAEERWVRVRSRNIERGSTYVMQVDRAMFDFMEDQWEAPDADELAHRVAAFW